MNYSGKFDAKLPADGSGLHWSGHGHVETISSQASHAPADAIIVPDAQLLFNGDFKRSGLDLVLSTDNRELVLRDYFKGEKHAALSSPDGAHLTGDIVNALTGHVEYAQAGGAASAGAVIGHVTKLTGSATATRNGVSIILNQGDNVEKGDVVQSGSDSTLGITFIDGTVFGLSSNARMVLNEMVYDPNGSNNSSLLSLVAGTITFVAGETAKHGDMKVDTPVATMGIRGTAVLVEIDFKVFDPNLPPPDPSAPPPSPTATFQVLVEPDGTTGSYILFDKTTLLPLITVDKAGTYVSINNGNVSTGNSLLSPDVQKLITDVFSIKFTSTDSNTKLAEHFTDTLTPQAFTPIVLANGTTAIPVFLNTESLDKAPPPAPPGGPPPPPPHIDLPPTGVAVGKSFSELLAKTGSSDVDKVIGTINFTDINAGDLPTVSAKFDSYAYKNAAHQLVQPAALNALQLADIVAVEAKLVVVPDPGNNNNGSATWTYSLPDSAFDFLAAGETLTLNYVALIDNNFAQNDAVTAVPFTIVITGTNDVPVITSGPQTITLSGGAATPDGPPASTDPASGTLAFADVDLTDTHTKVTTTLTEAKLSDGSSVPAASLAALQAALAASVTTDSTGTGDGTISWQLASLAVGFIPAGQTLTLTYTVVVTDSQNAVSDPQTITVTVVGIDHLVVTASAEATDENGASALSLAFNNEATLFENSNDSVTVTVSLDHGAKLTQTGTGALVTDNHDGTFTLTAHSVADLSGLTITPAGEFEGTVQVSVSAVAHVGTVDSAVGSTSTNLAVHPVADQPVVTASAAAIDEDGTSALTLTITNASGLFENSDDSVTITVTLNHGATLHGNGVIDNDDGTFTLTAHSAADLSGLTITPASEFEGTVTVGVSAVAHDGTVDSVVGITSTDLTINPLPETPAFTASAATIDEDGTSAVTISIANLAELTEDGTDTLTVKISGLPNLSQNGEALAANDDGSFTLTVHSATAASDLAGLTTTPVASFEGSIPFSVAVTAHDGAVDSATVSHDATLTVNPLPETPAFTASAATIDEDGTSAVTISIANLAELTEDGTDTLTVKISGLPNLSQNGEALAANDDGSFTLTVHSTTDLSGLTTTPAASFEGSIPFSVAVTAHDGAVDSATVSHDATLTVNPLPETPAFTATAATIDEDGTSAVTISIANLAELTEDGTDTLTVKISGLPNLSQNGEALTANDDGSFTLTVHSTTDLSGLTTTPAASFEGSIPFSVAVTAHDGAVDSATVSHDATLTVNPLPETPAFTAAAATIDEDGTSAVTISIANLAELTEDGTDTLTVKISGLPNLSQNGEALAPNEDGSFTLTVHSTTDLSGLTTTPAASFEGSIPFSVAVTAHDGAVDSATVSHDATLTVNPLPETPAFTASAATIDEDGTSAVTISIANLAELTEDGTDTLTVKISGLPNLSQNGEALTANEDGSFTLTVHSTTDLSGLTTTPAASFEGSIPFSVAVTAHDGAVDSATVSHDATLTVNPLPETPAFTAVAATIDEDGTSAVTISIANLAELTEDGTDTLTVKISGLPNLSQNGEALTANDDGSFTLTVHSTTDLSGLTTTPAASFEGSIPFSVAVTAHDGAVDSATVSHDATLTVNPLPETPAFTAAAATIDEDGTSAVTISIANLAELTEDGTDTLTVKISGLPNLSQNGEALAPNEDGSFTLTVHSTTDLSGLTTTPAASFEGSIPFSVAVTAHDGAVDSATVSHDATLTVNPLPETPAFTATAATIDEDGTSAVTISIANLAELTEDGTDTLTVKISGLPNLSQNGVALAANDDGSFTLTVHSATAASDLAGLTTTPAASFEGSIPFSVAVTAHDGAVDSATVSHGATLTVNPLPETPALTASAAATTEGNSSVLTLALTNATELFEDSGDSVTITVTLDHGATLHGTGVTDNHDGTFTLTAHSAADLSGLTIAPASEFEGTVAIKISAIAHDGTVLSAAGTASTTLTVNPVADVPVVTVSAPAINENGTSALSLTLTNAADLFENSDDSVTFTVTLNHGATLHGNGVTDNHNGTFTLTAHSVADLSGLTITPVNEFEGTVTVGVSAVTHDGTAVSAAGTASTTFLVDTPNDLVATLSSQTVQDGVTIRVTGVKDGDTTVTTGLSYKWQDSSNNGLTWTTVGTNSSFTPDDSDEGKLMQLIVTYTDANGSESSTYSLGMPNDLVATLDKTTAEQGVAIHVTSVKDGGTNVGNGVSYVWQVSSDNGQTWTAVGTASSYTPVLADDGKLLEVIVTYVDSGERESVTDSVGIVAPAKVWNGGSHDWQTANQWTSSGAPTSSDDAVIGISGNYTVSIGQDAVAHSLLVNNASATVEITAGHMLTLGGDLTVSAGAFKIDSGGTLKDVAAVATITGGLTDNGTVEAAGGTLEIASTAISGAGTFQIDAGATLQIDHADALGVTFAASSGKLILLDPAHFTGKIAGISGSGDVLDLHGFAAATTTAKTGAGSYNSNTNITTLTVTDTSPGHHVTETFKLVGNLSNSTWTVTDDQNGGANIVDPPGTSTNLGPMIAYDPGPTVGPVIAYDPGPAAGQSLKQELTGFTAHDTFVFNFAGVGHTTVTDFDPAIDVLQFNGSIFPSALAALNATNDDGHGNTVVTIDAQDSITLAGVVKAQLHSSDFHFI